MPINPITISYVNKSNSINQAKPSFKSKASMEEILQYTIKNKNGSVKELQKMFDEKEMVENLFTVGLLNKRGSRWEINNLTKKCWDSVFAELTEREKILGKFLTDLLKA